MSLNRSIAASIPRTFKKNSLAQCTFNLIIVRGRTKTVFHGVLGDDRSKWDFFVCRSRLSPNRPYSFRYLSVISRTSDRLRHNNSITLTDIHLQLETIYNAETEVQHMRYLANWSQLCENTSCLVRVQNFSQYRYFRFTPSA